MDSPSPEMPRPVGRPEFTNEQEATILLAACRRVTAAVHRRRAESTGGLYIRRSVDLGPSVGKIADDLATYYEVAYPSPLHERNGQFRTVSLRVSRPQTRLQSRSGYFALPAEAGPDTAPFEVPLLKVLSRPERTETIPFRIDILHLGQAQGKARGEAVLELPLGGIDCKKDPALGVCDMHYSVLAMIKGAGGQVLEEFSQDVPDQMASEGMESASNSVYTLDRSFVLPPENIAWKPRSWTGRPIGSAPRALPFLWR